MKAPEIWRAYRSVRCGRQSDLIANAPRDGEVVPETAQGLMAEWLRRGLQILAPEFDSRSGLHRDFLQRRQTGAVIQPITVAALTPAVTMATASARRALRWMKTKTPPNMMKPSPDAATPTQARPFIKVYKALIAIP